MNTNTYLLFHQYTTYLLHFSHLYCTHITTIALTITVRRIYIVVTQTD